MSILNSISSFAKENNITIEGVYYKFSDIFPESFYETVINYLQRVFPKYKNDPKIESFYIGFDENKNAYFEFVGTGKEKSRVIIIEDNIKYNCNFPASLKIKESIFLENVKNLDNARANMILNSLPLSFIQRFIKAPNQIVPLEEDFDIIAKEIIYYINYLENEKNKSYKVLEEELESAKETEKIYFIEAEASQNTTGVHIPTPRTHTERKNDEISIEKRNEILSSYSPSDEFEAIASNSSSIYYVKVFKLKEKCKLVMEPKEGNKYTKIVHLDNNIVSREEIKKIVIDSLQLSRSETTKKNNITRHSHTTIEEYQNLLKYLIEEKNTGLYYGTRKNIDEASQTKTR